MSSSNQVTKRIARNDLWQGLGGIKQKDWIKAADRLSLFVSTSGGRGSHIVIRDPKFPNGDTNGLIATVQKDLTKIHNQTIFKHLLDFGLAEVEIWKALKKL